MKTYTVADVAGLIRQLAASNHATTDTRILRQLKQALEQNPPLKLSSYHKERLTTLLFAILGTPSHSGYVAQYRITAIELLSLFGDKSVRNAFSERLKSEWFEDIEAALRTAIETIDKRLQEEARTKIPRA